jgi:hypothetical protein
MTMTYATPTFTVTANPSTVVTGNPRTDPIITKPGFSAGSDGVEDSDHPPLYGPDFSFELKHDITGWRPVSWMPAPTSLSLYARALFGEFEVFDQDSDLELYSVGLRLSIHLLRARDFALAAHLSTGPAWLRTDIGDATGMDAAAGLRGELRIAGNLALVAGAELDAFFSENVLAWGPVFQFGLNLLW